MGLPLSLAKGLSTETEHKWIGGLFTTRLGTRGWEAVVRAPPAFLAELGELLRSFVTKRGHASQAQVEKLLGKAGRLAYLIPLRSLTFQSFGGPSRERAAPQKTTEKKPHQTASPRSVSGVRRPGF